MLATKPRASARRAPKPASPRYTTAQAAAALSLATYCPHDPTPHQARFLGVSAFEALYGGAAGGGKTDALLMAALQYAHVPGYAALMLRRTYPDLALPGAIMDRAGEWLRPTGATWHEQEKTWRFPSGATLTFGYLQTEADKYRYQGAEFQFLAVDEATQLRESQYRYMLSRLRRLSGVTVPIRARCASNPGGIGHEWVKARFVDPDTSGDRVFIPARLDDNPHLDRVEYEAALAELDPLTRRQLRDGDWDAMPTAGFLRREWFRVVDQAPADLETVARSWDEAASEGAGDWTVGARVGYADGVWYILDIVRERSSPAGVDALIDQAAAVDGWQTEVILQQEPGSAGKARVDAHRRRLAGRIVRVDRPTGDKLTRARILASAAEAGNVALVNGPWTVDFLTESAAFPDGAHDDQVDAVSWAMLVMSGRVGGKSAGAPAGASLLGSRARGDTGPQRYGTHAGAGSRYEGAGGRIATGMGKGRR